MFPRGRVMQDVYQLVLERLSSWASAVWDLRKPISVAMGPILGFCVTLNGDENTWKEFRMAGILVWMAFWWLTEAVPAPITALLPLPLFPTANILPADDVAKAYWNDIVVLYFGSLVVALCIERWKVHRRLALKLLLSLGSHTNDPRLLLLGFIGCTGILSVFMSNTATSIMMVPMAVAVLHKVRFKHLEGIAMHTLTMAAQSVDKSALPSASEASPNIQALHEAMIPLRPEDAIHITEQRYTPDSGRRNGSDGAVQHAFIALPSGGHDSPRTGQDNEEDKRSDLEGNLGGSDAELEEDESEEEGEREGRNGSLESAPKKKKKRRMKGRLADMDDPVTQYCRAIVLGIAYAASIGGMGSLTATGPNLILAGAFRHMFPESPQISYLAWLGFGLPICSLLLVILWATLCVIYCPPISIPVIQTALDRSVLEEEYNSLGPLKFAETAVMSVFVLMSFLWLTRNSIGGYGWGYTFGNYAGDGTASALCAVLLFVIPSLSGKPWQMLMDWEQCRTMPWDIVLLLGGGFALSAGVTSSGLSTWIGDHVSSLNRIPPLLISPVIAIAVTFGTEFTSNSASATVILPLLAGLSLSMNRHPLLLMLPATLACSLAFMLPIATAQNAVAYSTGFLKLRHLLLPGIFLNLFGVLLISVNVPTLGALIFGVLDDPSRYSWYTNVKDGLLNSTSTP